METNIKTESARELNELVGLPEEYSSSSLELLNANESKFLRDLKMNLKSTLKSDHLTEKESALIALSVAVNDKNKLLTDHYSKLAKANGASTDEISEAVACASLLSSNNVLYRFRHFTGKEKYTQLPARLRMNIMMNPAVGKEFFELISLAVSAVNGCEMCVNAHEHSLIELGTKEERIFDAIKISSVVVSLGKVVY